MMRRLVPALLILGILALIWSGAWYWLAGWTGRQVPGWLAEAAESGVELRCPQSDVVGYPFALRVDCEEPSVAERETGTNARLQGLTGGISIFAPTTAEIALASPARIESPLLAGPAQIRWDDAEVDLGMGMSGPRRASFDASGLSAEFASPEDAGPVLAAAQARGGLSPSPAGGTNAAISFTDLTVTADGATYPPVSGSIAGHVSAPPRELLAGAEALEMPLAANGIEVSLASGEARLQALGDIAIDADGVMDGTIILRLSGAAALPAFIAALPPEHQQLGNAVAGGIFAFGQPTTLDGEQASELTIEIERGEAKVGPVEITLPRVPF